MTSTAVPPPHTAAESGPLRQKSASLANSYRVTAVAERLTMYLQSGGIIHPSEFFGLCLTLARGIDFAVANSEVPTRVEDLPPLLKKICNHKSDSFLQAAIMTLMVSVKSACNTGWFQEQISKELCALANEMGSSFCSPRDTNAGQVDPHSVIPLVMSKFYPLMKMGEILACLEVKPAYGGYVVDFQITKGVKHSSQEKIRLFVVQTDNTDSSACLISPPQVSFLLNGKGVDRRTNIFMDLGPQVPTNITTMLKYGTNLLQAVGQFNGHYYIAVAFMRVMTLPENPALMDYVHPDIAALDPDSDIIEGPSRISLNCPISYRRIKTPVKGHSCKHLQCFDFSNYVDINSRRPSWRCPHCNQHVCYTDIRVDQNMVKVLSEVGENVSEVIITADGSWKAVLDSDDSMDEASNKTLNCSKQGSDQQDSMHVDLTTDDDTMDAVGTSEMEDIKPVVEANLQNQPVAISATQPSQLSNANAINQPVAFQMGVDILFNVYFAHQSVASNARFAAQVVNSTSASVMPSIIVPNFFAPPLNSTIGGHGNANFSPVTPNQVSATGNSQLQQSPFVNSNNEYGRIRQIPAHINRNPIAVQALPVPSQTPSPQQRPRASTTTSHVIPQTTPTMASMGNTLNVASQTPSPQQRPRASTTTSHVIPQTTPTMASVGNTLNAVSSGMNRQHQFPGPHINQLQNRNIQSKSVQQTVGVRTSSSVPSAYPVQNRNIQSQSVSGGSNNLSQRQGPQMPLPRSQAPTLVQSSPLLRTPVQSASPLVGSGTTSGTPQYGRYTLAAERATQMARQAPSVAASGTRTPTTEQTRYIGVTQAAAGVSSVSSPAEQDGRPTGRMRGSLSGRNFDAYRDFVIQPTQPSQPPRISNLTSPPARAPQGNLASHPTSVPPHLQSRNRNL